MSKSGETWTHGVVNRRLHEIEYMLTPDGQPMTKLRKDLDQDIMREAGPMPTNAGVKERKAWVNKVRKSARKHAETEVRRILNMSTTDS